MSPTRLAKLESAMRIVLKFHEAFNRHDVGAMMQFISEDCAFESAGPGPDGSMYAGKTRTAKFWHDFFQASPRAQREIEEIFGLGERCVMRWNYRWQDEGGQVRHVRGVDVFRVKDELIVEQLSYTKG